MKFPAFLLSIAIFACQSAVAAETNPACGTIHVAYYEHGALYYHNSDGSYAGIDKDVVEELAKRSGCLFETSLESRVRIWTQLEENTLDASVSGIPTPERKKFAEFIPYMSVRNYVLLHKEIDVQAQTMAGFLANANLKVGVIKSFKHGTHIDAWLDQLRSENRVYETSDFDSLLRLFFAHRVDAVFALPTSWQALLKKENIGKSVLVFDWVPQDIVAAGLIISKKRVSTAKLALLRKTIYSMADDGTLEQIFSRHVGPKLAHELLYEGPRE